MPLKYTTSDDVKKIDEDINWYKSAIARYRAIFRKDKEGVEELISLLKDNRDQEQRLLDGAFRTPTFGRYMRSSVYAAHMRTYQFIIDLLENPEPKIQAYQRAINDLEKDRNELRKLPKRD